MSRADAEQAPPTPEREQLDRLAATLHNLAEGVITVNGDGRIAFLNQAAEALTGWTADDALHRPLAEVVREASVALDDGADYTLSLADRLDDVLSGQRTDEWTDMQLATRDGRLRDVEVTMSPLREANTGPVGAVLALRDITRRRRAEAALEEANRRLREQTRELAKRVEETQSLSDELEQANDNLQEANLDAETARTEVETLHQVGSALASELDLERIVQAVTDAATSLTGAKFGAFFYNTVDKHGEKLTLYTLSGAPRAAFENFGHPRPTPVFAPTFYGTAIMRSDDITQDPRYGQMGPHHGMPPGHLPVRAYLAVPVVSRTGEVIGGLFFGHEEVGVFSARAERLATGIATWAALAMDNARLYEAERRARGEAEEANRAKSRFLANMSHELRTPLNAIGGYADLLMAGIRGTITDQQRADLERIKRSQHHLLSLINDILNFAKVEAGRVRFDFRHVSMNTALGSLEPLVAPQLLQKSLRYEYRCCDPEYTAYVDGERLQQILLNLLSNAVKFTPPGGEIHVDCGATRDSMIVQVRDSGVGIPADKLEKIFEPFVQLDRGQSASAVGTGLGLSISRELARAMGGDLTAASALERGSTFTLTLPRSAPRS